ncbi:Outer membrane protein IcsA autotransporter precursor [Leminorella grimontii]|uniref:autotransporter outer membrane beta-barrel domain-containing protein n=7 Tax=Leminorella grimontii TaxID=82981 RepID=UPI00106CA0C5|nr:autotransporter outer membrane beta-barrel domain-containing protein [Leminorella grimontii]VFS62139.1 Outer membrane protein IcsA autotransporter precursor [Leminorella grimontii]
MNKIYRVIWNCTLGLWVVTSELGRGRIKRATNRALAGLTLAVLSPVSLATDCDNVALECQLDSVWSTSTNNNRAGTAVISDGQAYRIDMLSSITAAKGTSTSYGSINALINAGYATGPLVPDTDSYLQLSAKNKNITVFDPITNSNLVVTVYDENNFREYKSTANPGGSFRVFPSGPVDVYYNTRFVAVTNGQADVYNNNNTISASFRDSQLFYADGSSSTATINWHGTSSIGFGWETSSTSSTTYTAQKTTYVGEFSGFDGSTQNVTNLSELKAYNAWLVSQVQAGNLSTGAYASELTKAYQNTGTTYVINPLPADADPILLSPPGTVVLLHGTGSGANINLASDSHLTSSSLRGLDSGATTTSLIRLTSGANAVNDGYISTGFRIGVLYSGSRLTNNGTMITGTSGGIEGYGINVYDAGTEFINNGTFNVIPRFWSGLASQNQANNLMVTISNGAKAVNNGVVNLGITEGTRTTEYLGQVVGAMLSATAGSFINGVDGEMYVGRSQDGKDMFAAAGSAAIKVNTLSSGTVDNQGLIALSTRSSGAYGITASWTKAPAQVINSGTITLKGDGGGGAFLPGQNIGIYAYNSARGVSNTGTVNVGGVNNVGVKTLSGGQIGSSGQINVTGSADPSTDLRNYGAWAEGANSLVDISGTVNLEGDGAIGLHARDKGTISLSGNGQVTFADGENQIGYYVYGAGSKITNTSTGSQDVTTNNSTLMRLDGGAAFVGSSSATSTMSASGEGSTVIVATGADTTVDSGGMTVNVNGKNATGFLVEGGATGTIGATATINLSGEGAIAGIADGQGHDLAGVERVMTDDEKRATRLTAGAHLTSSLDGVVGYIARNLATLTNSGNISFSGKGATGIQVEEGAVGGNSGNITLSGAGSVGLSATANTTETRLSSTGNITLNGDWDGADSQTRSAGVLAKGSQVEVTVGDGVNAASVNLNGAGTVGVHASEGSKVTLNDNVAVNFDSDKSDQIAFWIDGAGSAIDTLAGTTLTHVHGDGATLFYVTDGASLSGDLNLNLSGKVGSDRVTSGIRVNGEDSRITLAGGSQLTIGTNATGVLAENGGKANIEAGAAFNASGINAVVGKATGEGSTVENHATVTSLAGSVGSTAFLAQDGGTINNQGNVNLSLGAGHTAIDLDGGHVVNTGDIQASGTAIHIKGANGTIDNSGTIAAVDGVAAIHVDAGAGLDLRAVSGSGTIVAKGSADGILLDTGATGLNVADTVIDMSDASSSGIGIHNVAGIEGISLENTQIQVGGSGIGIKTGASLAKTNSGVIEVTDGTGILYQDEDGSSVAANLDFSDSAELTINVAGSGIGVKAMLDGNNRTVNTGVSVNVNSATGGSAIDVSGAKTVSNSGNLVSQSTVATGNVLNVHDADTISNSGTIQASSADIAAIAMSNTGDKTFTNTGDITGSLDFTSGDNRINLTGGTLTGNIAASGGANTLTATNGSVHTGDVTLLGNKANVVTVSEGSQLGNVSLGDGNHLITVTDSTAGNIATGDGNSLLTLAKAVIGDIALGDGDNTLNATGATTTGVMAAGSGKNVVTLKDSAHLGGFVGGAGSENHITVSDSATFGALDAGTGGSHDTLTFDGIDYTLAAASDAQRFDIINLTNGSTLTTGQHILMGDTAASSGLITIDGASSLVLNPASTYALNHALSGNGLIDVQSGTSFDFGANTGSQFAGRVNMNSDSFALSGFNTTALTKAILSVMGDNVTTVGSGVQTIGGLAFSGGTVDFGVSLPNASVASNRIAATSLDASGTGRVMIDHGGFDNGVAPVVNQTKGLLDQQTETLVQLASSTSVTGEGGNLQLVDENGNAITNASSTALSQNGTHAADAYYDYRLTTKDNSGTANGLYVGYGLTRIDLLATGSSELVINTANSNEKVLSAKVTGSGDLGIAAGNGANALTLSNLDNSYTGETDVQSGTLIVGTNNALGQTANLKLATATTVNLNGKTQTIGALNGAAGSTLSLNGGSLTLTNGGTSSGSLTGSGNLTVAGGSLTVTNANTGLSATTTVNAGAEVLLNDVLSLGSGNIVANGDLTLHGADGTFANAVSGSGTLSSRNGSDVRLSGNNGGFTGVVDIDMASTLTVSETQHLGGAIGVLNSNRFIVDNTAAMALNALVSGTGDLIKQNAGTLTLGGTNVYSGKTDIQAGTVAISADANLGDGSATNLTVLNGGNLQITADLTSARDVTLEKSGSVIVDSGVTATMSGWDDTGNAANAITKAGDGTLIWTGNNGANTADVNVTGGVLQVASLSNLASANGTVNLNENGSLSVLQTAAADLDFTRALSGSGVLKVDLGDSVHDFTFNTSASGGDFTGTVTMDDGRFVLDASAQTMLARGTLALNGDGTRLGSVKLDGSHTIGGLTLNGGRIEVDYSSTDHRPQGTLTVNTLDATGGGQLTITTPANLPNPIPTSGTSLFDQDDNVSDQIVIASTVNGVGSQIQVTQADGTPVAADTLVGLVQDGVAAGNAHYNYFGAVKSDGLYLGYGLTQLDAFAGQSVILSNAGATDDKLGARLTGDGGFTVNATGTVRIGNAASDYLGATDVNSGTVVLITDNGFGKTSSLNMQSGSGVDLNGNAQTVGQLDAQSGSSLNLNGGALTISNGGTANGSLTGGGQLTLTGGTLDVTQNNGSLTATTDIENGATARLTQPQGLGKGAINLAGTLNLDTARGTLFNNLSGNGEVTLTNGANMYLGGNSQHYTGLFTVNADTTLTATTAANLGDGTVNNDGTLVVETDGQWTLTNAVSGNGSMVKRGSGTVVIDGDNVQASQTTIENGVLQLGKAAETLANLQSNVTIGQYGALGGYGTVTGNVTNAGNLVMGHALTGAGQGTFTIDGDYAGDGGTVIFNTDLGGDGSSTDKLLITGDSSGESKVSVVSARGNGAQTENGIKLIEVQGASNGTFTQSGRALAGAYEYFLYQGGVSTPDDGDWYLRSALNADNPQPSVYRPEAGGYMANMAAANRLFTLRLSDREGRAENSSLWLRQAGSRQRYHDNSGQLNTSTNSYVIQGGGEISHIDTSDTGRAGLGVMLGYGYAKSKTDSQKTGYQADSSVKGYSSGLYGTWYQDANTLNGAYVDSWVQYSWLDAEVSGQQVASESYDMDGFSASLEAGYRMPVYESANGRVYLTPQGQVTWSGITADTVREANGTKVTSSGDNNVQTRLGLKVSRDGVSDIDKGKEKLFTVYAEANWLYNSEQAGATMDGVTVSQAGGRNVGELKLGAEGQLNRNLNLWSNVAQQLGDKGYSDTAVTLGVKYRF